MFEIVVTREFEKRYKELSSVVQKKIEKQEKMFRVNPFHPSLHTEKLLPKQHELWSIRVDLQYRIVFRFLGENAVVLLSVGTHDRIYRLK